MRTLSTTVLFACLIVGCDSKGTSAKTVLHPCKGKLVRGTEPVAGGYLTLRSDTQSHFIVTAKVEDNGTFEAFTVDTREKDGKRTAGAPEGTYKGEYGPPGTTQEVKPVPLKDPVVIKAGANELTIDLGNK